MVLKPTREHATNKAQTCFVTSKTWENRALFRAEPWARLFFKTLVSHRGKAYLPMVWTNANKFHRMIDANRKHLEEVSKNNATQK